MGHYLSESYSDEYWEEQAAKGKALRKRIVDRIRTDIETRGIEEVLADIVEDPAMYRIHSL